MRIFVFEHIVGGGELHAPLPYALATQGAAMLTAAVLDFQRAGHDVITTRDMRANLAFQNNQTFTLMPGDDVEEAFDRAAQLADAVLVIAPESSGLLGQWTRRLEQSGVPSLGATFPAIELCGDKFSLYEHLAAHDIPTPRTVLEPSELALPVVAKPRDGAGCEQTYLLSDDDDVHVLREQGEFIFQPWQPGRAVSVSFIGHGDGVQPLLAGEQAIERKHGEHGEHAENALHYRGGRVPLEPVLSERAVNLAMRAAGTVEGLRGYGGVDLVLAERPEDDVVIEINPRMTVSFVALTQLCEPALATVLLEPVASLQWSPRVLRFDEAGRMVKEPVA